jgi:type IV secretory pathway VirB10-like protein
MKLATGILILGMGLGTAAAQNPSIVDNTKAKLNAVQQQKTVDTNAALAASQGQKVSPQTATAKPAVAKQGNTAQTQPPSPAQTSKPQAATAAPATAAKSASKTVAPKATAKKTTSVSVNQPKPKEPAVAVEDKKNPVDPKKDDHKISMAGGRRDPFLSPVVNHSMGGSGCSTGKRCLAVDQIALTGIVKSDAGMIAVVVNAMNKAYFLRENDPVFNGYVVKITGDSIIFKETMQDKLGKSFTREVTKKISTPAV